MENVNKGLTVKELAIACAEMLKLGYGDKHIQISMDDEGNAFHSLFYLFTADDKTIKDYAEMGCLPFTIKNTDEIVLLG